MHGKVWLIIILLCWLDVASLVSRTASQSISHPLSFLVRIETVHNMDTDINYTTIQAAINDQKTLDGHTIFIEEGTYYEHVVVNKSISVIGENRDKTKIDGTGNGTIVSVNAQNVSIRNITLINAGSQVPSLGAVLLNGTTNSVIENVAVLNNPSWA